MTSTIPRALIGRVVGYPNLQSSILNLQSHST